MTIPALSLSNGNPTEVIRYQHSNHLGSASLELDDLAEIISYEEYHPFGTTSYRSGRTETETSQKRYKYVGKERDEETGLYYYGARYYAAWICRFVSVDPLQFDYPYYTPYQYAGNKPISYIDLDGLEEKQTNSSSYMDRKEAAMRGQKSGKQNQTDFNKLVRHEGEILSKLSVNDLGRKPMNRLDAHELLNQIQSVLKEQYSITGNYTEGFKFDKENWLANHNLRGMPGPEAAEMFNTAKTNAEKIIKTPFFMQDSSSIQVLQINDKDENIDWGKIGTITEYIGDGVEIIGYIIVATGVGTPIGLAVTSLGKAISIGGISMQLYEDITEGRKEDAIKRAGIFVVSETIGFGLDELAKTSKIYTNTENVSGQIILKSSSKEVGNEIINENK